MNNKPLHISPTRKGPKENCCGKGTNVTKPRKRRVPKRTIRKRI